MEQGTRLADRYVIEALIGQGGIGRVYRALDERTHKRVAIKVNLRDREDTSALRLADAYFEREQKALMLIEHPGVLRLVDRGRTEDGCPFVVTELLSGASLRACIDKRGPLPQLVCIAIAERLLSALAAAHSAGIVHRDIKPENLFLCSDGRVVILDFGIARGTEASGSETMQKSMHTQLVGTASYLAPEQLQGVTLSTRCDLFSLGGTLFALLTGKAPFERKTVMDVYQAILTNDRMFLRNAAPNTDSRLCAFVELLLSFDPAARPADASEAADLFRPISERFPDAEAALRTYARAPDRPETSTAVGVSTAPLAAGTNILTTPGLHRRRVPVWMVGTVVALGLAALTLHLRRGPATDVAPPIDAAPPLLPSPVMMVTPALAASNPVAEVPAPSPIPIVPAQKPRTLRPREKIKESVVAPAVLLIQLKQWAIVSIDGEDYGKRQLVTRIELPSGDHVVRFSNPAFPTRESRVRMFAGKELRLQVDLSKED